MIQIFPNDQSPILTMSQSGSLLSSIQRQASDSLNFPLWMLKFKCITQIRLSLICITLQVLPFSLTLFFACLVFGTSLITSSIAGWNTCSGSCGIFILFSGAEVLHAYGLPCYRSFLRNGETYVRRIFSPQVNI